MHPSHIANLSVSTPMRESWLPLPKSLNGGCGNVCIRGRNLKPELSLMGGSQPGGGRMSIPPVPMRTYTHDVSKLRPWGPPQRWGVGLRRHTVREGFGQLGGEVGDGVDPLVGGGLELGHGGHRERGGLPDIRCAMVCVW